MYLVFRNWAGKMRIFLENFTSISGAWFNHIFGKLAIVSLGEYLNFGQVLRRHKVGKYLAGFWIWYNLINFERLTHPRVIFQLYIYLAKRIFPYLML